MIMTDTPETEIEVVRIDPPQLERIDTEKFRKVSGDMEGGTLPLDDQLDLGFDPRLMKLPDDISEMRQISYQQPLDKRSTAIAWFAVFMMFGMVILFGAESAGYSSVGPSIRSASGRTDSSIKSWVPPTTSLPKNYTTHTLLIHLLLLWIIRICRSRNARSVT